MLNPSPTLIEDENCIKKKMKIEEPEKEIINPTN
jgi:hypothetical protein